MWTTFNRWFVTASGAALALACQAGTGPAPTTSTPRPPPAAAPRAAVLAIVRQPRSSIAGVPMGTPVVVQVRDSAGSPVTRATLDVTLAVAGPSFAGVYGRLTASISDGLATFSEISMLAGSDIRLVVTSPGLRPDTSQAFEVIPWEAAGRIAFVSGDSLIVMDTDGSHVVHVADGVRYRSRPSWSPDTRRLAFADWPRKSGRCYPAQEECFPNIWILNADGSRVNITADHWGGEIEPAWSPDGTRIAFTDVVDMIDFSPSIWVMNADGSVMQELTDPRWLEDDTSAVIEEDGGPAWSPDGRSIAFQRETWYEFIPFSGPNSTLLSSEIWIMSADGTGQRVLVRGVEGARDPAWSADGGRIVFGTSNGIAMANADGSNVNVLTNSLLDRHPSWSPDGRVVFTRGNRLYVMNADGTDVHLLPQPAGANDYAAWMSAAGGAAPVSGRVRR